jgi:hypothetical protein
VERVRRVERSFKFAATPDQLTFLDRCACASVIPAMRLLSNAIAPGQSGKKIRLPPPFKMICILPSIASYRNRARPSAVRAALLSPESPPPGSAFRQRRDHHERAISHECERHAYDGRARGVGTSASGATAANSSIGCGPGASAMSVIQNQIANLENQMAGLQNDVRKSFEGTAIAIALSGGWLPDNRTFAIATNYGNFRGQGALSVQGFYRVHPNIVVNGGVAAGFAHNGVGSRPGALFAW